MRSRPVALLLALVIGVAALAACTDDDDATSSDDAALDDGGTGDDAGAGDGPSGDAGAGDVDPVTAVAARLEAIEGAALRWQDAATVVDARSAAEAARNLVVGPDVDRYGDGDGDREVSGAVEIGLLPGQSGEPGLVSEVADECLEPDVLGGSWDDPAARWDELTQVLDAWSPTSNTMPRLASHPMRIVGWATLAIETDDLAEAQEYAGHALLHVDVSVDAVADCA
ncbi:MAG: hypothetical protein S0880_18090 [Actinomycetota bacterium]|nr:hypothetical protein [Actinomycetota bacterium]